jgi:hypothetical protein
MSENMTRVSLALGYLQTTNPSHGISLVLCCARVFFLSAPALACKPEDAERRKLKLGFRL